MINVSEMKLIQIVLTNVCPRNCCHCSQMCPHVPQNKKYFMDLEQVEKALWSLQDYPGHIGLFGGEPTIHPQFEEICKLMQKYVPVKLRRELWTEGTNYNKHREIINETFYDEGVAYNEHEEPQPCWHQPNNIAIKEMIDDEKLMWKIINNCWVQLRWSAAITPMGAYFCEVASARAYLLGNPKGLKVEAGWWKRPLSDFEYQKKVLCPLCSMCLPMPQKFNDKQKWDDISRLNYKLLSNAGSPKIKRGEYKIIEKEDFNKFLKDKKFEPYTELEDYQKRGWFKNIKWSPNIYRMTKKHTPEDVEKQDGQNISNNSYSE